MTSKIISIACVALFAAQAFAATHTVTFRRMNGTVLSKVEVEHGGSVAAPEGPVEPDHTFKGWDHGDWLGCVTNDIQVWALYEGTKTWAPGIGYGSQSIVFRDEPYSLDEYFQLYDNLAWADEFSRPGRNDVNRDYWNYDMEDRHELNYESAGANQKEYDGNLAINVRREHATRIGWMGRRTEYAFTGGGIKSNGKVAFRYGRCEIRAKLTRQKGCWPAFWMMGNTGWWPRCGELDILEQPSGGDWISGGLHIDPPDGSRSGSIGNGSVTTPQDGVHFGDGFHRFGTIMNEREIIWYVDDYIFSRMDVRDSRYHMCHDRPWFIIFGMGIQSNVWVKVPDAPATKDDVPELDERGVDFLVDYCRIYTNTKEGNTVPYQPPAAEAKLSASVKATVWRGWDLNYGRTGSNACQGNVNRGYAEVDYIKSAMLEYLGVRKTDVLIFLTEPSIQTVQNRASFDIPGYTMQSISFNGNPWNNWDNPKIDEKNYSMGRTQLFGNVLFNRDRFSSGESGVDFMTLSGKPAFTNCYAAVADLKEIATGARVKVVGVNVTTTNGIENADGTVAEGFNTLFSKLNAMKNDNVIVFFQGMSPDLYDYIKARADSTLQAPYAFAGKYTSTYAHQCAYVTECLSATAEHPATVAVTMKNLSRSYPHNPQALQADVTFDELPGDGLSETFTASDYAKSMDVTFSGYSGEALSGFPVLVRLSTAIPGFRYADFRLPNGGDLRFTDASGNLLPHEIDTWDESGVSTVWVKVPSLTANATIVAHYGCASPVRVDSSQVWDDDYVGVWHLGETGLPLRESSGTSADFTRSCGDSIAYAAEGVVGGAVDFLSENRTNAIAAVDHAALDGFPKGTFEVWTKQNDIAGKRGILSKSAGNAFSYRISDGPSSAALYMPCDTKGTNLVNCGSATPALGVWNHLAYTFDTTTASSNVESYLDGVRKDTKSVEIGAHAGNANLCLGTTQGGSAANFVGQIDEVRISKTIRTEAWLKATHDTIADDGFATYAVRGQQFSL